MSQITEPNQSQPKKYRSVKCPHCNETLDRNIEPFVTHNKRYYHKTCFESFNQRATHRKELIDYICELYNIPAPTGFMLKQIKEFEDTHGYTLKGMEMTLRYFHEIKQEPVLKGAGIGIVEYFYNEARDYYTNLSKIRESNSKVNYDNNEEIIYIKPPKHKSRKLKQIDIGGL
ncbi:hypothetical protein [Siminovitchia sp. 179-K 8D1 HS]|uniref:hypothetical protein n=1 Tax=Siminovitchia sp. 179-K 8D1 HS TaxID=3142385 RepID=UPI0039A0BCFB